MKNIIKKHNILELSRGFTLIETFVAITILMITVIGPMSLLSSSLRDSRYVKDQIIATYLAQEGVELVLDYRNNHLTEDLSPASISNCQLKLSLDEGYQCSGTGTLTVFSREVSVSLVSGTANQYEIVSTVTINNSPLPTVVSSSIIFN